MTTINGASESAKPRKQFDAVVIGSGQGGTPLATALAKAGKRTALIESTHIAGCCVNEGCTPTKTMIASGRIAHLARRGHEYGVWDIPSENLKQGHKAYHSKEQGGWENINVAVDMLRVRQRKRDIVDSFRSGSEARLKGVGNLEVIMGEAAFRDSHSLQVELKDGGEVDIAADSFFVNAGERPSRPSLPGLDSIDPSRVLNSTSIMELGEVPHSLIVIGGSYIGLEFGQLFRRLGSKVTIFQRSKQLVPREDPEIADAVREVLEAEGVTVLLNTTPANIKPDHQGGFEHKLVVFYQDLNGRNAAISGSHILLAAGRTPNTDKLNLSAAGVNVDDRGHIKVDDQLRTSQSHIFALGDVHGGPAFTHASYSDFRALRSILSIGDGPRRLTAEQIPYCMFTDPQLGHIGLHEQEARKVYRNVRTASMPMKFVARALETDMSEGLMKGVVDDDTKQILGFTCFGLEGGEIMSIVQTAMMGKLPYTVLQDACYAHPTLAESLNNLWGFLK